jgi:hypothetical protein
MITQGHRKDASHNPNSLGTCLPRINPALYPVSESDTHDDGGLPNGDTGLEQHGENFTGFLCAAVVLALAVVGMACQGFALDAPSDHRGADEVWHVRQGHGVAGIGGGL